MVQKRIIIKTPFPSSEQTAAEFGITKKRYRELMKMVDGLIADYSIRAKDQKNGVGRKKKGPVDPSAARGKSRRPAVSKQSKQSSTDKAQAAQSSR
jgi:hypothetical protein